MPIYVPRELLHAQGVLPVGIMGGGDDLEIIRGDAYYQSYICHIPRSTIELGLNGSLDCLDGMIFPAICDVIRNLSGMWKLQFPGKLVALPRRPAELRPRDRRRASTAASSRSFRADLADSRRAALRPRGAARVARGPQREPRAWSARSTHCDAGAPWKVPTSELYLVLRAGLVLPVEEFDGDAPRLSRRRPRRRIRASRWIRPGWSLTGSFCEQPPLGLIKTLERAGCYIVDDDFVQVHRWIKGDIPLDGDPLDDLVRAFLTDAVESPDALRRRRREGRRARRARARAAAPRGCSSARRASAIRRCSTSRWRRRAVDAAGIPWTAFKYAENNGQFQVIREQAGTFADSIKLWSGV